MTVLVLEAGADRSADLNVLAPGLFPAMYGNADYDWDYKTVPQVLTLILVLTDRSKLTRPDIGQRQSRRPYPRKAAGRL